METKKTPTIIILGGDGYLGWPTAMHFASLGWKTCVVDNFAKRKWEGEIGVTPLFPIPPLQRRARVWNKLNPDKPIVVRVCDIASEPRETYKVFREMVPDVVVHYGEQPSAPYSMRGRDAAVGTIHNNVIGTTNVVFAMQKYAPDAHLIKLGTMGEYGTPNIDIEEGWLTVTHNGREDRMMFPKKPGSLYHVSKVMDSTLLEALCRFWGIRVTDLNQGVVYGFDTPQTKLSDELVTSFHYDEVFGTVLNRFVTQAVAGFPLTVYGNGSQTRGYLNINDTLACVTLAASEPAEPGEFRVFNQFTEQFSVAELAKRVRKVGEARGLQVEVQHLANPRVEQEDHYYNARHSGLEQLGLQPRLLTDEVIDTMFEAVTEVAESIDREVFLPSVKWKI